MKNLFTAAKLNDAEVGANFKTEALLHWQRNNFLKSLLQNIVKTLLSFLSDQKKYIEIGKEM